MKKYLQKSVCIIVACMIFSGCSRQPVVYQKADTAMGTIINQTIYVSGGSGNGQAISEEVISCINELETEYLSWRLDTSEVYQINASAGNGQKAELSGLLGDVLEQCEKVYTASDGAFDFTVGKVAGLWDIDSWAVMQTPDAFIPPTDEEISGALAYVGSDKCRLEAGYITLPEGMELDLGAVGKGLALDEVQKVLAGREEVSGAVISVGGSILTYGSKPDGSNWNVGIVNPGDTSQNLGTLSLAGEWYISTSGDYERFIEKDGIRYHHILDPHTGKPADSGVKSVTIICTAGSGISGREGLYSDALSTACFVLGVEDGLKLAEEFGAEALFVDAQDEIYMTEGMKQYFHLSNAEK